MGRWSRRVAHEFLNWLEAAADLDWADIGCGTGQLTSCIIARREPRSVRAVDAAEAFVGQAQRQLADPRIQVAVANATTLPWRADSVDVAVSGLVLNFVPDHDAMAHEMTRVTKAGGTVAAYVWDYAGGMQMMRHFWDAAVAVNPEDKRLDQAERFPICQPAPLRELFEGVGLASVDVRPIDIGMVFRDFDDYWTPFLGRQGAAPTYLASLDTDGQRLIRDALRSRLAPTGGPIKMTARAWAVRGLVP